MLHMKEREKLKPLGQFLESITKDQDTYLTFTIRDQQLARNYMIIV